MTETTEPPNHEPPRQRRRTHHAEEKVPQLRQSDLSRRNVLSTITIRDVDVDGARLEDGSDTVRADGEQPALVLRETVAAQQHTAVVLVVADGQL